MVPVENWLIGGFGWQSALFILGCVSLAIVPLAFGLHEPPATHGRAHQQTIGAALREAFGYRSFQLLMAGYFVCGFQVVFIGVHLPSYLKDHGLSPSVATTALALIGLFNVIGTYAAGTLGQHLAKRHILAAIYVLRSVAIVAFVLAPLTPASVYVFASVMGVLWLSTVPPTNAVVAQIFGVQYMSMLGGFVFFSHQIGSFLGVWLGGRLYDTTGSYDVVWWIAVALGVFAALVNLPVREGAIARVQQPAPA
jgi:predicted MFS family arabinose efflux permease